VDVQPIPSYFGSKQGVPGFGRSARDILGNLTSAFWTSEWTAKSLDTSAGRRFVIDALTQVRRNIRRGNAWYADVDLIDTPDPVSPS
jgi:hypothetical protein